MNQIDLDIALERPSCPRCNLRRIRPVDIQNGTLLSFECPIPRCGWRAQTPLPAIRKTIIYLDTSTVSHMAKALQSGDSASPWMRLHTTLRRAVADEVLCCPASPIVHDEAERSLLAAEIIRLSEDFADPGLNPEMRVRDAQLSRALERFLRNEPPRLETDLPSQDAFARDIHQWLPVWRVRISPRYPPSWVQSTRHTKERGLAEREPIYEDYARSAADFEAIRAYEVWGYGHGLRLFGEQSLRRRLALEPVPSDDPIAHLLPNTYDLIVDQIAQKGGVGYAESWRRTAEFLESDHVQLTPMADLQSRLHAALAMRRRGPTPRCPQASDIFDIDHIATFMPYVDIFIADRFFASLCNQRDMRLGDPYGTEIRTLGEKDIDSFIGRIDELTSSSQAVVWARRIAKAIQEGGYHQELAERMERFLMDHVLGKRLQDKADEK